MSVIYESEIRSMVLKEAAHRMMAAARTAPKAKGIDNLVISIAEGDTIRLIAEKLKALAGEGRDPDYFVRDAENILLAEIVVLIGTKINPTGIKFCGLCGYKNCAEKSNYPNHPCALNTGDLGIAIGSAVSIAMETRIDNRIMHSVGMAVLELGLLDEEVKVIYGIPLSIGAKNPFFDRR